MTHIPIEIPYALILNDAQEYLPTLTTWFTPKKNIEVGDIVVIIDGILPRNTWPRGRIIKTTPGKNGIVRHVTIETKEGIVERPTVKVAV